MRISIIVWERTKELLKKQEDKLRHSIRMRTYKIKELALAQRQDKEALHALNTLRRMFPKEK